MFRYTLGKVQVFLCYLIEALIRLLAAMIVDCFLPQFKHKRLKQDDKYFRLVTIHPPKWDYLIRCSVKEEELGKEPSYEALSYTWYIDRDTGSPIEGRMRTMICNGKKLRVHQNLYNALLQLRNQNRRSPLWIDAICIDQANDKKMSDNEKKKRKAEKSAQVRMMKTIFGSAKTVVVWLGRSSIITSVAATWVRQAMALPKPEKYKAVELIQSTVENPHNYKAMLDLLSTYGYSLAFYWIFSRGFFERVWTLQEVVLAKEMLFLLGDQELPVLELASQLETTEQNYKRAESNTKGPDLLAGSFSLALCSLKFAYDTRREFLNGTPCPLEDAIEEIRRRKTTKEHDKFFSVVLISPPTGYKVDYDRPIIDVYCDCAAQLLQGPTGIHLLSLVGQLRHGCTSNPRFPAASTKRLMKDVNLIPGLPSWVPDLNTEIRPIPFRDMLWRTNTDPFKSDRSMEAEFSFHRGGRSLRVKAAILDVIEHIGDCLDVPEIHVPWTFLELPTLMGKQYQPTDEDTVSAFWKTLVSGERSAVSWRRKDQVRELTNKDFTDWFGVMADQTPYYGPHSGRHILANSDMQFSDREAAELDKKSGFTYYYIALRAKAKRRINTIRKFIDTFDCEEYPLRNKIEERYERKRQQKFHEARYYVGFEPRYSESADPPPYQNVFETRYLHRCLFLTKKKYLGTGPWTIKEGDVVMLVAGAEQPYVFRSLHKNPDTWELIGEAYCHGFMSGEALHLPDLKFEMREIV
ncbi:heterokaryon incompatibility [Diplodia corticola]|uniref:Heterokaryon incompatibility n=1 Tax=Diplodia corticola TaxID=236234 RepID=A0A1J9RX22_9PEZI|nr:heterokaryon incompatibility [Diplodia corticola]OJD32388.1 heterokaryon incompatibility [Diplodia corticola]